MSASYIPLDQSGFGVSVAIDGNFSSITSSLVLVCVTFGVLAAISFRFVPALIGFMSGDGPAQHSKAKENLWAGVFGLAVILLLIPFATSINSTIGKLTFTNKGSSSGVSPVTGVTPTSPPGGINPPLIGSDSFQLTIKDDPQIRQTLNRAGININNNNNVCTFEGATNCTSLGGTSPATLDMLLSLKQACPTCDVTVTGGTEYWAHSKNPPSKHFPGGRNGSPSAVDLRKGSVLDAFLKKNDVAAGTLREDSRCFYRYTWGGFLFCDEKNTPAHWHVNR